MFADKLKRLADIILRFSLVCYGYKSDLDILSQLFKPDISLSHMTIFGNFLLLRNIKYFIAQSMRTAIISMRTYGDKVQACADRLRTACGRLRTSLNGLRIVI